MCDLTAKAIGVDVAEFRRKNLIAGLGVPVPDAGRVPVRQRELRAGPRPGAPDGRLPEVPRRAGSARGSRAATSASGFATYIEACGPRPRRWRARSAPRPASGRAPGARPPDREGHGLHRLALPRPGARDHLRPAGGRRAAACPSRTSRSSTATPGPRPVRHGHLRQPQRRRRRLRDLQRASRRSRRRARRSPRTCSRPSEADIEYHGRGRSGSKGRPSRVKTFGEVALMAYLAQNLPEGAGAGARGDDLLRPAATSSSPSGPTSRSSRWTPTPARSSSCATWRWTTCGRVINPMIVDGQVHGGIAQGVGAGALRVRGATTTNGQLQRGSMMDYALAEGGRPRRPTRRTGP